MASRRRAAAFAATSVALFLAAPAAATPPTHGSGIGTVLARSIDSSRDADGNVIQVRESSGTISGTFDGVYNETVRGVIHKDGIVTFHGVMHFFGAASDCGTGPVTLEFQGKAIAGIPVSDGQLRTIDEGGSNVPVHVNGSFTEFATSFTYEGEFHCD
jgi:hypothetical protein